MATKSNRTEGNKKVVPIGVTLWHREVQRLPMYKCCWCGAEWLPRKNMPKVCPTCHRRGWMNCGTGVKKGRKPKNNKRGK